MIFDPALDMASAAGRFPAVEREPFDLPAALPRFDWPVAVHSGDRDLRTSRPVATRTAELLPDAEQLGLVPDLLLSTWDLRPCREISDFLVVVLHGATHPGC